MTMRIDDAQDTDEDNDGIPIHTMTTTIRQIDDDDDDDATPTAEMTRSQR